MHHGCNLCMFHDTERVQLFSMVNGHIENVIVQLCIYFCGRDKRGLYSRSNFEVSKTLRDSIPNNLSSQTRMQLRILLCLVDITVV